MIGAGGIGFDVAEYLTSEGISQKTFLEVFASIFIFLHSPYFFFPLAFIDYI